MLAAVPAHSVDEQTPTPPTRAPDSHAPVPIQTLLARPMITPADLIASVHVTGHRLGRPEAVTLAELATMSRHWHALGIRSVSVAVDGAARDEEASASVEPGNLMSAAIQTVKDAEPGMSVIASMCLCAWTLNGRCVLMRDRQVDLAATQEALGAMAVCYAEAGADQLAPATMLPDTTAVMRFHLDQAGRALPVNPTITVGALGTSGQLVRELRTEHGDVDAAVEPSQAVRVVTNTAEAMVAQGAEMLTLKPAPLAVDLLTRLSLHPHLRVPLVAATCGWDGILERLGPVQLIHYMGMLRRAGADLIKTTAADSVARLLAR